MLDSVHFGHFFWLDQCAPSTPYLQRLYESKISNNREARLIIHSKHERIFHYLHPLGPIHIFVLNKLFYLFYNYQLSAFIRVYSLWLYVVIVAVNQNINMLSFSIRHFQNLFSLNYIVYHSNWLSVVMIGVICILVISIFPLSLYIYGGLSKYFLTNMYRMGGAFFLAFVQLCIKPAV